MSELTDREFNDDLRRREFAKTQRTPVALVASESRCLGDCMTLDEAQEIIRKQAAEKIELAKEYIETITTMRAHIVEQAAQIAQLTTLSEPVLHGVSCNGVIVYGGSLEMCRGYQAGSEEMSIVPLYAAPPIAAVSDQEVAEIMRLADEYADQSRRQQVGMPSSKRAALHDALSNALGITAQTSASPTPATSAAAAPKWTE